MVAGFTSQGRALIWRTPNERAQEFHRQSRWSAVMCLLGTYQRVRFSLASSKTAQRWRAARETKSAPETRCGAVRGYAYQGDLYPRFGVALSTRGNVPNTYRPDGFNGG